MSQDRVFLTAEWRNLAMLNYEVEPGLLTKFVPTGTELDRWNGKVIVSLVGFRFLNTTVCGFSIPFHRNFDEVNLRFYVRRKSVNEIRRGVVFVREIVPRWAIAAVARGIYNERYVERRMRHRVEVKDGIGAFVEYNWRGSNDWNRISVSAVGHPEVAEKDSEKQFITEHYWGYSTQRDGGAAEYRVAHPSWRVWKRCEAKFAGNAAELFGPELAKILLKPPCSAFLADGSEVTVFCGRRI